MNKLIVVLAGLLSTSIPQPRVTGGNVTNAVGTLPVAHGGTGSTTASGALTNLGAAASGANADITSLTSLSTPLSVGQGGTGSSTQNFVDLSTTQAAIAGNKTFTGLLAAGSGPTTITNAAGTLRAAALDVTLSGSNTGDITLGAIGSTANANGASLSGQALTLQPASASFGGIVTTGTQTMAGAKTLSSILTLSATTGLILSNTTDSSVTFQGSSGNSYIKFGSNQSTGFQITDSVVNYFVAKSTTGSQTVTLGQSTVPTNIGGALIPSTTTGITAHAGGGQASATALTLDFNVVTTVGTTLDSVKLPACTVGRLVDVINQDNSAALVLDIYPLSGGNIDALGANAPYLLAGSATITGGTERYFRCTDGTNWISR